MPTKRTSSRRHTKRPAPLVLVADDVADNREMYSDYLAFHGLQVITASDGHDALKQVATRRPDVVVVDIGMPGVDGLEICRRLKSDDRTEAIPILVVTGHVLKGMEERAKAAGCDAYLMKPCLPEQLLTAIRALLRARDSRR